MQDSEDGGIVVGRDGTGPEWGDNQPRDSTGLSRREEREVTDGLTEELVAL